MNTICTLIIYCNVLSYVVSGLGCPLTTDCFVYFLTSLRYVTLSVLL